MSLGWVELYLGCSTVLSNIHYYITVTVKVNLLLWSAQLVEVYGLPANCDPCSFILLFEPLLQGLEVLPEGCCVHLGLASHNLHDFLPRFRGPDL